MEARRQRMLEEYQLQALAFGEPEKLKDTLKPVARATRARKWWGPKE